MGIEIERKFRVTESGWLALATGSQRLRQAYLCNNGKLTIRVRVEDGERATLNVKTADPARNRVEYEYVIPVTDAEGLLALREGGIVERVRHKVAYEGSCWEIDVFSGENEGLVVAEIELSDTQQTFKRPPWLGDEVTGDLRFYNASLAQKPFRVW
jgi:adenylate cyclase